jgi:hypothetical protein
MGGSSSSSTTNDKYSTTYINSTDTKLLNESVNNFVAETVVKQAQSCGGSISNNQTISVSGAKSDGGFNFDGADQNQSSNLNFSCVQVSTFKNDIANGVLTKYLDAINGSFNTTALDKMSAAATAASKNGFGSVSGASKSDTTTNTDYSFTSNNTTNTDISNVVENAIQNNLSMESISNCISDVKNSQTIALSNLDFKKDITIGKLTQTQAATLVSKCLQESGSANAITNAIATDLGVTQTTSNVQTKSTTIDSKGSSIAENQGVGSAIAEGLAGFSGLFSGIFSSMFGGLSTPVMFSVGGSVICIVCCLLVCVACYFLTPADKRGELLDKGIDGALQARSQYMRRDIAVAEGAEGAEGGGYLNQIGKALIKFNKMNKLK